MNDGVFNVYKPTGMTSHDVVWRLRKLLQMKKIGHGGTLDPMAEGVLPIFIGKATRFAEYMLEGTKGYRATIKLGIQTSTGDQEGEVIAEAPVPALTREKVEEIVASFVGASMQIPPMYSALKQQGRKLYELAREGKEVERAARPITIYKLQVLDFSGTELIIEVDCSKGTYIRTLGEDIAKALGTVGSLSKLVRYKVGGLCVEQSVTLEQLAEGPEQYLCPLEQAVDESLTWLQVNNLQGLRIAQGVATTIPQLTEGTMYAVKNKDGLFIGIAQACQGRLKAKKIINIPEREDKSMQIITSLEQLQKSDLAGAVMALGTFDGIHKGHQDIIAAAKEKAQKLGKKLAVFTFATNPLALLQPQEEQPPLLLTKTDKEKRLAQLGVEVLVELPFTAEFAALEPQSFVELLAQCKLSTLVVGANYTYGKAGKGTAETLQTEAGKRGMEVIVRPLLQLAGQTVSSTCIRQLIQKGDVALAKQMLGRSYSITGTVVHGNERGRTIGFPTANLNLDNYELAIPLAGGYVGKVLLPEGSFKAVMNVGHNPTFANKDLRLEVHLLDFKGNLYDRTMEVEFISYIRPEKKFPNIEALKEQIEADKNMVDKMSF